MVADVDRLSALGEGRPHERGGRDAGARDRLGRPLGDDPAPCVARLRADFKDPVRGLEDVQVVLDDDEAVAALDEGLKDVQQPGDIVAVEARRGLVQEKER